LVEVAAFDTSAAADSVIFLLPRLISSSRLWLAIQNGALAGVNRFEDQPRYIRNGRDLGEYVHRDFSYQPYLTACLAALKMGTPAGGANPYKHSRTQSRFTTFGQPYPLYVLAVVTQVALDACWFQKWRVHRRLRPEELGGRVEARLRGLGATPCTMISLTAAASRRSAAGTAARCCRKRTRKAAPPTPPIPPAMRRSPARASPR
jgi:hypothetical protein